MSSAQDGPVLIVAHAGDEHGNAVITRLEESNTPWQRMEPLRLGEEFGYAINPLAPEWDGGQIFASLRTRLDGEELKPAPAFRSVYWRRPFVNEDRLRISAPLAGEIAGAEAYHAFRLTCEALPRRFFPLGHPCDMDRAGNKLWQLRLAKEFGLDVPETLVANDPAVLRDFLERHERVVVKPLHCGACYTSENRSQVDRLLWCRGFEAASVAAKLQPGQRAQLLVQQAVPKEIDWRVTVLPHCTIACAIETKSLSPNEPDWRKRSLDLPHSIFEFPAHLDATLRRMLAEMNLTSGYFDFAVAKEGAAAGSPVFLEVNTNANWLWIEHLTGVSISGEIAKCLTEVES